MRAKKKKKIAISQLISTLVILNCNAYIQTREDSFDDDDEERKKAKGQFTTNMKVVGRFKSVVKKGEEVSESSEDTGSLSQPHPKG